MNLLLLVMLFLCVAVAFLNLRVIVYLSGLIIVALDWVLGCLVLVSSKFGSTRLSSIHVRIVLNLFILVCPEYLAVLGIPRVPGAHRLLVVVVDVLATVGLLRLIVVQRPPLFNFLPHKLNSSFFFFGIFLIQSI